MPDPSSILWLIESPNHSGAAFAARNLAAGMLRTDFSLHIFALRDGDCARDFAHIGCPALIRPRCGRLLFAKQARTEAAALGVSLVHAQTPDLLGRAQRLARALRVPLLVTANRLERDELVKCAGFGGAGIVAVSDAIRERLVNVVGLSPDSIRVIPNGLDLARIPKPDFSRGALDPPGRVPVVGTLGQLSERKGQRVFLQAVRALLDRGLDAEFVVLGDGPDRSALRRLADELCIGKRVTFTPRTVSGQLTQLDLLVEPSLQEGLGLSVMQAMAMGVPVVGTGVGGLYSLIEDGKTGLMVAANDPLGLADAIWRVLHYQQERIDMARQARELIENRFSADLVARRLGEYYEECRLAHDGLAKAEARGRYQPG